MTTKRQSCAAISLVLAGWLVAPVSAGDLNQSDALELRRSGVIRPFEQIIATVYDRWPGATVVEAELSKEEGRYIYEVEIFTSENQSRELELDASTLEVLEDEPED